MEYAYSSPQAGNYSLPKNISFAFMPQVTSVAMTQGNFPPSLSKYIAYDTLTPPTPFIAVTEDGNGRVLYDGGFPKLYNGRLKNFSSGSFTPYSSFSDMPLGLKYFYNAIRWISEGRISRKVLILGDNDASSGSTNYQVKNTTVTSSFGATVPEVCRVAGFSSVAKDSADYTGGKLDPTLQELQQYACVILVSSRSVGTPYITTGGVQALVDYRKAGGGILIVTDHGYNLQSIEDVNNDSSGFFKTANAVASQFGAYFTGSVDRQAVNIGFLRQTYGDHPVYAGLLDTESFAASGSESLVVVTQTPTMAPNAVPAQTTSSSGYHTYNFLMTLQDGSVQTKTFKFNINPNFTKQTKMLVTAAGRAKIDAAVQANTQLPNLSIKYKSGTTAISASTTAITGLQDFVGHAIGTNPTGTDTIFSVVMDQWKKDPYPCTLALVSGNDLIAAISIDLVNGVDTPAHIPLLLENASARAFTPQPTPFDLTSLAQAQAAIDSITLAHVVSQPTLPDGNVLIGRGTSLPCWPSSLLIVYEVARNEQELEAAKNTTASNLILDLFSNKVLVKNATWEVSEVYSVDTLFLVGIFCQSPHNGKLFYRADTNTYLELTS